MYLVAVMDWHSRKVLSWRISNTLDSDFCVSALEEAIARYGCPEIFNTDQRSQFISKAFTKALTQLRQFRAQSSPLQAFESIYGHYSFCDMHAAAQGRGGEPESLINNALLHIGPA